MAYKQSILWKIKSIGVAMVERYISTRMSYPTSILIIGNEAWLRIDLQFLNFHLSKVVRTTPAGYNFGMDYVSYRVDSDCFDHYAIGLGAF